MTNTLHSCCGLHPQPTVHLDNSTSEKVVLDDVL